MTASASEWQTRLEAQGVELERSPYPVAAPEDVNQLADVLRFAASEKLRVVPTGLGGKLAWCRPEVAAGEADLLLSTRRLDAVIDYVPGDGTLTAQAGCTLSALGETVATGGHRITPDVPRPASATLGGVLGAGQSGPDREALGPVRHHVLGCHVVLADGTTAKSGGRLVKNVTGFDLHRLYTGSRGTLCVIIEASLRLFPIPEEDAVLEWQTADAAEAIALADAVRDSGARPRTMTVDNVAEAGWRLHVGLAGRRKQIAWECDHLAEAAPGAELQEGAAARARSAHVRDLELHAPVALRLSGRPSRTLQALQSIEGRTVLVQPGAFVCDVFAADDTPETVRALRTALPSDVHLAARHVAPDVHTALARDAATGDGRWMRALAERLDPEGLLACPTFPRRP
ncbi:MAG: FAD-binding oxidoreductase [bacterium]|nr:FAD-binding oxidoreductase [bacterium]